MTEATAPVDTSPNQKQRGQEHVFDVLMSALEWQTAGEAVALAVITGTEGGAVRAPGAMMAVNGSGARCGYVSGGCIDSDVALRAQAALNGGQTHLRYGAGSPFMDIRLPCGGAIDLEIIPQPATAILTHAVEQLVTRKHVHLAIRSGQLVEARPEDEGAFTYRPRLKLRIAGRGEDPLALARLARASHLSAELWSPDEDCLSAATQIDGLVTRALTTPDALPHARYDNETAFVLMFHDGDWEGGLLEQALDGNAFYIGAVGSRNTHSKRREMLAARGIEAEQIDRVRGPIGLVPSMRDASMLAVSTLAEIVDAFHAEASV